VSSADTVPVLIALDAEIRLTGKGGDRWIPVAGFYRDDGLEPITLAADEIVAEVKIPPPALDLVYSKLRIRQSFDFPLVGAATGVRVAPDGTVSRARIVLTAVGSHPIEVVEAERILEGNPLTEEVIRAAGERVFRVARPMDNTEGSIPHRKRMARVYVERALRRFGGLDRSDA
jgi:CO/xanthine dehydrogenase FAD-binding subunit